MEQVKLWIGNQLHTFPQAVEETVDFSDVPSFDELIPKYLKFREFDQRCAVQTIAKDKECMKWFMKDISHIRSPNLLTLEDITTLKQKMIQRNCGPCRINSVLNTIKSFLKFSNQIIKINTINPQEIKTMKIPKRAVQFLTDEEIKQFRECIGSKDIRDLRMRTLFEVLLSTGMRIGECLDLDKDMIDWEQKSVMIIGKGNKQREVYFTDEALQWLKLYLLRRQDDNPALFVTFGTEQRLTRFDISKLFKRYAERSAIRSKLTPHALRRTMATKLSSNGCDIRTIQLILGHSDIKTTARYYLGEDRKALKGAHSKFMVFD